MRGWRLVPSGRVRLSKSLPGEISAVEPPDPIPNSEVKRSCSRSGVFLCAWIIMLREIPRVAFPGRATPCVGVPCRQTAWSNSGNAGRWPAKARERRLQEQRRQPRLASTRAAARVHGARTVVPAAGRHRQGANRGWHPPKAQSRNRASGLRPAPLPAFPAAGTLQPPHSTCPPAPAVRVRRQWLPPPGLRSAASPGPTAPRSG